MRLAETAKAPAASAYRFTRFGRGPGRYSIHLRTATGRRFRHAFRIG